MSRNRFSIAATGLMLMTLVGCSDEYGHERLDADGPEATQVRSLVSDLRDAGRNALDETIARQVPAKMTEQQLKGLKDALGRIASADSVELQKIERFGDQVYRAVLALETSGGPKTLAMLLAVGEDDTLKWLGRN